MEWVIGGIGGTLLVGLAAVLAWRSLRRLRAAAELRRARDEFQRDHSRLEAKFLHAAALTGKPRGLRWKAALWEPAVEFVREKKTGKLAALAAVAVQFEAIEGGDMEDVAAVADLKN